MENWVERERVGMAEGVLVGPGEVYRCSMVSFGSKVVVAALGSNLETPSSCLTRLTYGNKRGKDCNAGR